MTICARCIWFESLIKMDRTQIMLLEYFSHFYLNQLLLPDELLDHLSLLKFDDEDRMSITKNIFYFLISANLMKSSVKSLFAYFSSSPLKVVPIDGVIPCHLLLSIPFLLSSRSSIKPSISITTKMFLKESLV